jgi:hypothetical protein
VVGARGFEPPTPWSRSRQLKNYKCHVWCRLPGKTATNLPLELDGSWTESRCRTIEACRGTGLRQSCARVELPTRGLKASVFGVLGYNEETVAKIVVRQNLRFQVRCRGDRTQASLLLPADFGRHELIAVWQVHGDE